MDLGRRALGVMVVRGGWQSFGHFGCLDYGSYHNEPGPQTRMTRPPAHHGV